MRVTIIFSIQALFCISLYADDNITYGWPIWPWPMIITSTFGEYRGGTWPHFHEGNDFPKGPTGSYVYSIAKWYYVEEKESDRIKLRHYYDGGNAAANEGSRYLHLVSVNQYLQEHKIYFWNDPEGGWLAYADDIDHLHAEYRKGWDLEHSENPFVIPELRVDENYSPKLNAVFVDYSLYGEATVEKWEFLGSNFGCYSTVTGGGYTFVRLELPTETPFEDWDDPHILISGNRKVRFTVQSWDETTEYNICGPYTVEMYVDANINFFNLPENPIYKVEFDFLNNDPYPDKNEEEDTYHTEGPIQSGDYKSKYYRLYKHDAGNNGLPNVIKEGKTLITEELEQGQHMIRIIAADWNSNMKTGDFHIYIRESEWVDYCRGFRD